MLERGISPAVLADWLEGFHDTEATVHRTVDVVKNLPI